MLFFEPDLIPGIFIERKNRFLAIVEFPDGPAQVHVPNTGRMKELLWAGAPVLCSTAHNPHRKTKYSLQLVRLNNDWMAIDTRFPNNLVKQAIEDRQIEGLNKDYHIKPEVTFGSSRLDLGLLHPEEQWLIENKCCTLVRHGIAKFPDAPTERGRRHMEELKKAIHAGYHAAVFFVIQCSYAKSFRPNDEMDPKFGQALRESAAAGTKVYAYNCKVNEHSIALWQRIPIEM